MAFTMFNPRNESLDALFDRPKPSQWQTFFASPLTYLARLMYSSQRPLQIQRGNLETITVVCISDTHNCQPEVPDGDLLIHAGDLTQSGTSEEVQATLDWIESLNHLLKVLIAGNHDLALNSAKKDSLEWHDIQYLEDSSTRIQFSNGRILKIFGRPWTPTPGTWAFQHAQNEDLWTKKIPDDTDILVTHGPPRFHLDAGRLGDASLLEELWRVRPRLHVFGHIHYGYGRDFLVYDQFERCYENIFRGSKGGIELFWMITRYIELKWRGRSTVGTQLVNAAIVGGLRDEERRNPLVVSL